VKRILGIPEGWALLSIVALGHPDERPVSRRLDLKELVHVNKFGLREGLKEVADLD
jgi:nitroreductase